MSKPKYASNAAIVYAGGNFDTGQERLMGRHSASEGFLRAFVQHGEVDTYYCHSRMRTQYTEFHEKIATLGGAPKRTAWIPFTRGDQLARPGCLYRPGPDLSHFAWNRRRFGSASYSICGVTHTTAEHAIMDYIANMLTAPVQRWDALICTSRSVRAMVMHVLEEWQYYYDERLGVRLPVLPQLPVIPLGIDTGFFEPPAGTQAWRSDFRAKNGIAMDDIVFLFLGRLNPIEKANPAAMYQAIEGAAKRLGRRLVLVQAGWFPSQGYEEMIRDGAAIFAPSVHHVFTDGRPADVRKNIWHACDIFISLSDNIQETFGLTPVEAMAAGLPVIGSDWDGYRETVRHEIDGILVPTLMPAAPAGEDLAHRYESLTDGYGGYCSSTSQSIAVDIGAAIQACAALAGDPDLRRHYGENGRRRAREVFDWSVIMRAYHALWSELAVIRRAGEEVAPAKKGRPANPGRADPFALFDIYPTNILGDDTLLSLTPGADAAQVKLLRQAKLTSISSGLFLPEEDVVQILHLLARRGPMRSRELAAIIPPGRRYATARTLTWMVKTNLLSWDATTAPGAPVSDTEMTGRPE